MSAAQKISLLALTGLETKSFSLLWRGSRDGFDAAAFHRLCDGKASTLTVIKNTDGFIFGGFATIPWSSSDSGYQTDYTAFLFSLTNKSDTPLKLKVKSQKYAVHHLSKCGPSFGGNDLYMVNDLHLSSLSNTNRNSYMHFLSYEFPYGISGTIGGKFIVGGSDHSFQTVETEVFQVV